MSWSKISCKHMQTLTQILANTLPCTRELGQLASGTGHRAHNRNGHRVPDTPNTVHQAPDTKHRAFGTGHRTPGTGFLALSTGYIPGTEHRAADTERAGTGHRTEYWAPGYRLPCTGQCRELCTAGPGIPRIQLPAPPPA